MSVTCDLKTPTEGLELRASEATLAVREFYVLRSPLNAQCVVARPGEQGTAGWQSLYGPDTTAGCWLWIDKNPRYGLRL